MTFHLVGPDLDPLRTPDAEKTTASAVAPRSAEVSPSKKRDPPSEVHRALRAATRNDHAMIDRMLLRLNLTRRTDYGLFLHIHYTALQRLEADWRPEDLDDFAEMARRARTDLHALGMTTATPRAQPVTPGLQSHRTGVAYVIRGSRLGAAFLRRGVPDQFPSAYLDFSPLLSWPQFLHQMEGQLMNSSNGGIHEAIHGARATFETFAAQYTQALA